jgi:hypothetical protein
VESSAGAEADFGTNIEDPLSVEKIARPTEDPIPPKIAPSCAAVRQAWMDERHPGWSCVEWSKHTGNAYETIKKYWDGITTNRTRSVRADIAKAEEVAFSTVPE